MYLWIFHTFEFTIPYLEPKWPFFLIGKDIVLEGSNPQITRTFPGSRNVCIETAWLFVFWRTWSYKSWLGPFATRTLQRCFDDFVFFQAVFQQPWNDKMLSSQMNWVSSIYFFFQAKIDYKMRQQVVNSIFVSAIFSLPLPLPRWFCFTRRWRADSGVGWNFPIFSRWISWFPLFFVFCLALQKTASHPGDMKFPDPAKTSIPSFWSFRSNGKAVRVLLSSSPSHVCFLSWKELKKMSRWWWYLVMM